MRIPSTTPSLPDEIPDDGWTADQWCRLVREPRVGTASPRWVPCRLHADVCTAERGPAPAHGGRLGPALPTSDFGLDTRMRCGPFRDAQEHPSGLAVGIGGGRHVELLCDFGFETSGVDISREGLRHCQAWLEASGQHADRQQPAGPGVGLVDHCGPIAPRSPAAPPGGEAMSSAGGRRPSGLGCVSRSWSSRGWGTGW